MRRPPRRLTGAAQDGVAMIVVMWVILVLSLLIGGFAYTMHVETQLASFHRKELKALMLARSGVEVARMQLLVQIRSGMANYIALNQPWATNTELLVDHELGEGKYTVKITDEDSKLPINQASEDQLHRLFDLLGVEQSDADVIVDSILDWIDGDDLHRLNGAESDYYESLSPPYRGKNGPLDRIEELLLVRGVTPEIFKGLPPADQRKQERRPSRALSLAVTENPEEASPGLPELLTTTSSGKVNINTASPIVLEAALGLDDRQTMLVIDRRTGIDGVPGTEDDQPFRSVNEMADLVAGADAALRQRITQLAGVNANFFTVKSTGTVGNVNRTIVALLGRQPAGIGIVAWHEFRGTP